MCNICSVFFNDTATTEIYTLSLHDALPIFVPGRDGVGPAARPVPSAVHHVGRGPRGGRLRARPLRREDRKSTRLNSSHANISYAVFCLKKKNIQSYTQHRSLPYSLTPLLCS